MNEAYLYTKDHIIQIFCVPPFG